MICERLVKGDNLYVERVERDNRDLGNVDKCQKYPLHLTRIHLQCTYYMSEGEEREREGRGRGGGEGGEEGEEGEREGKREEKRERSGEGRKEGEEEEKEGKRERRGKGRGGIPPFQCPSPPPLSSPPFPDPWCQVAYFYQKEYMYMYTARQ